jgi:glycosyltransferase involved in cell wall biosynthesis|tara:strand:- start:1353 stop:2459 length:1107 start_codon:yes stop_codon:yes gene_type:complete
LKRYNFEVYYDPTKTTSGQRFFKNLYWNLKGCIENNNCRKKVVLCNVSVPIAKLIRAKIAGQKIIIRIDGLYYDKLSNSFLSRFIFPLKYFLKLGIYFPMWHDHFAFIANFIDQNYTAFIRILFADHLIYQSIWSRDVHQRYFPNKTYTVITNGGEFKHDISNVYKKDKSRIKIAIIYNDWKYSKRIVELIYWVLWVNKNTNNNILLHIYGYTGKIPVKSSKKLLSLIKETENIITYPKFTEFDKDLSESLAKCDLYLTFSNRDPCPNVVVESMSHGLPIVAFDSGGVKDIVKDAGILLKDKDTDKFYYSYRFDNDFTKINNKVVIDAVLQVKSNIITYRNKVKYRFQNSLDIKLISKQYLEVIKKYL